MNSKHKNLKFTFETEDSNNFLFLDVKITRKSKRLLTSIFRKAIFCGVYTNYDSFILETYKIGLGRLLLFLFFKICSSMENHHIKVEHLRSIFKCNNYPINIIDQCVNKFLDKLYVPKIADCTIFRNVFFEFEKTFIYKAVSKSLPLCNIQVTS